MSGVSENKGTPQKSTLNCRILIIRTPKLRYPRIFGKSHVVTLNPKPLPNMGFEVIATKKALKKKTKKGVRRERSFTPKR